MEDDDYVFESKDDYCNHNHKIIQEERKKHESEKEDVYYNVHVEYFRPYRMYFLIIPKSYLDNVDYLRKNKNDIFAKGKILTFASKRPVTITQVQRGIISFFCIPLKTSGTIEYIMPKSQMPQGNPCLVVAYLYTKNMEALKARITPAVL